MNKVMPINKTTPAYAVILLFAAKKMLYANPQVTKEIYDELENAVMVFEENMPVVDGVIQTSV